MQRYSSGIGYEREPYIWPEDDGKYVRTEDYLAIRDALREALDKWDSWNHSELEGTRGWLGEGKKHDDRIAELRKFLDDK